MENESQREIVHNGVHDYSSPERYVAPTDPAVQANLKKFTGYKLGFMMHWAPGCQIASYESWPLCDGDAEWSQKDMTWADTATCQRQYREANKTFNPIKFNPAGWAKLAKDCGFRYLLFTTKHHDGFCMFDTKTTDYKITAPDCPFHTHPDADIVGALYREFKKQGLAISTYFSKPDWNSQYFWCDEFGKAPTRNVNYDIKEHPDLWKKYVQFVHAQIRELASNYGKIDVLWLDGGWVRPENQGQDIRLSEIVEELRNTTQPGLIVCERGRGGETENFITPEQTIPPMAIGVPWETCVTVGDCFSFHYNDCYKSGRKLTHLLLDVVSKGGNLALNIPAQPDGDLPAPAVKSIRELGAWLSIFGEGIYDTTLCAPYFTDKCYFTRKDNKIYCFYRYGRRAKLPAKLTLPLDVTVKEAYSVRTNDRLHARCEDGTVTLHLSDLPMGGAFFAEGFCLVLDDAQESAT